MSAERLADKLRVSNTERLLGSAWRDQPNQPQEDDRADEGGHQAADESPRHDAKHSQKHPSAEQRADHTDDDIP